MLAEALADESTLFIDAGANIGFYTLVLAHRHQELRVMASAPNPKIRALLTRNIATNELANVR
jgi:FkbM family methyltransferase